MQKEKRFTAPREYFTAADAMKNIRGGIVVTLKDCYPGLIMKTFNDCYIKYTAAAGIVYDDMENYDGIKAHFEKILKEGGHLYKFTLSHFNLIAKGAILQ